MAATRKLQAEIDRCLKKVAEGTEKFDETWLKVQNASNTNQKEKYEEDLKKEIKKLQRLRDQIKTWIASGEIKDKSVLMEKRKLIEMRMEKFKVVERETKTKAYSKEGLTSGTKLDPQERERHETAQWLNSCIDQLNMQIDAFEAEIESLAGQSKKKKNRGENADKIEDYNVLCEKHREHVGKLETLLRMLDNDAVNISQIKDIKDDVEYYIENCQEPDFCENDMMYDDIDGFEEMMLDLSNVGGQEQNANSVEASETMSTNSASSPIPYLQHNHSISDVQNESEKRRHKSSSDDSKGLSQSKVQPLSASAAAAVVAGQASAAASRTALTALAAQAAAAAGSQPSSGGATVNGNVNVNSVSNVNSTMTTNVVSNSTSSSSSSTGPLSAKQPSTNSSTSAKHFANAAAAALAAAATSSSTPNNSSPSSGNHTGLVGVVGSNHVDVVASAVPVAPSQVTALNSSSSSSSTVIAVAAASPANTALHEAAAAAAAAGRRDFLAAVNGGLNGHGPHVPASAVTLGGGGVRSSSPIPVAAATTIHTSGVPSSVMQQQQQVTALSQSVTVSSAGHSNAVQSVSASQSGNNVNVSNASVNTACSVENSHNAVVVSSAQSHSSQQQFSMNPVQSPAVAAAQAAQAVAAAAQQAQAAQAAAQAAQAAHQASQLTPTSTVSDDHSALLPSLKAMAKNAVEGLSISDLPQSQQSLSQQHQQQLQQTGTAPQQNPTMPVGSSNISQSGLFPVTGGSSKDRSREKKTEAHIPPLLGVAPLGPVPLNKETQLQYAMLEAAFTHMPQPSDSERIRTHLPRNPCVTPAYYPQMPLPGSDSLDFFLRLTTETLFFIFYYMEGTKAQYLAAKALKKQSWRFHTKYLMWFQRHEEPTFINEDYEQGTYVYFDFEKWGQRTKTAFKFEYRFLEDSDLI